MGGFWDQPGSSPAPTTFDGNVNSMSSLVVQISKVDIDHQSIKNGALSLSEANFDYSTNGTQFGFPLYESGCQYGPDGHDCYVACSDPKDYLGNLTTLLNCLSATQIVKYIEQASQDDLDLASSFGITSSWNLDVMPTLVKCYPTFFGELGKNATYCNAAKIQSPDTSLQGSSLKSCYYGMCSFSLATVDPDIGGIGVFISYIIQLVITLAGFLAMGFLSSWCGFVWSRTFTSKKTIQESESPASSLQDKLQPHAAILFAALLEFHRAQCFFAIALQVAAYIATNSNRFNKVDPQGFLVNYDFIRSVAITSIICVPFTHWYLMRTAQRSFYTTLLILIAWILSVATWAAATESSRSFSKNWANGKLGENDPGLQTYSYCANQNPLLVCALPAELPWGGSKSHLDDSSMVPAIVFGALIIIEELWKSLCAFSLTSPLTAKLGGAVQQRFPEKWLRLSRAVYIFGLFVWFLVLFVLQISRLTQFLRDGNIDSDSWGIGQIVAITIWLPAICELLQLQIFGMRYGFSHRLPKDHYIKRGHSSDSFDSDDDDDDEDQTTSAQPSSNNNSPQGALLSQA